MSTQISLGHRSRLSASVLLAVALGLLAVLVPSRAMADSDSVVITSPTDGAVLTFSGDSGPIATDVPLVVTFVATGSPATCAIDGEAPTACTSPVTFPHVAAGHHSVQVTAGTATQVTTFDVNIVWLCAPPEPFAVRASVHGRWLVHAGHTSVRRLQVRNLARAALVKVSCRGGGCPSYSARVRGTSRTVDLTRFLSGHRLRPGVQVVIRVAKLGFRSRTFTYTVRAGARPGLVSS